MPPGAEFGVRVSALSPTLALENQRSEQVPRTDRAYSLGRFGPVTSRQLDSDLVRWATFMLSVRGVLGNGLAPRLYRFLDSGVADQRLRGLHP